MLLLVLTVCLALELHQSEGSSIDALSTTNADQQKEIVDKHNECRRSVQPTAANMLEMNWDPDTAANAQQWANQCHLDHSSDESRIIGGRKCGENLFMSSHPSSWTQAIKAWDDEKKDFEHGTGATSEGAVIGHYTQVVWYSSFKVGCALAYCPNQSFKYYYVCQYCPAGNIRSKLKTPYAAGTPCGECPNNCKDGLCTNPCEYDDDYTNCGNLVVMVGPNHPLTRKPPAHHRSLCQHSEAGRKRRRRPGPAGDRQPGLHAGTGATHTGVRHPGTSEGSPADALMTTNSDQQREIVNKHNACRRMVQPPARNMLEMNWDPAIAANAQQWANQCQLGHSSSDSRIVGGKNCGENLFMSTQPNSWSEAIEAWDNEKKDFKYGVGETSPSAVVGHYTQVVWYSSYKVGCAVAYCPTTRFAYFYVCQYCPAGNMQNKLKTPYAVGSPCGECPNNCNNGLCTNPCPYVDKFSNCGDMVAQWGPDHPDLRDSCQASIKCTKEIK
uniref:uncharacterized protein LOC130483900 n=1 Tax=Euleptes europaea TaxID=460621 RepID=UPI00254252B4|nr:uncharacterized protein LOC130483900 [Euleptes europaea]